MTNFPLVSVIIPTYNSNFFLDETIKSILDQTYPHIELIIVDDCSTNGTREKLQTLQATLNFTLILLKKNSGSCSKAINEGVKIAKGKYICVCGHDDIFQPNKLAVQVAFLEKHSEFKMVYSNSFTLFNDEKKPHLIKTLQGRSGHIFKDLLLQKFYIRAVTVMLKKDVFNTIGYFDENLLIEDWDMWLRIANIFPIGFINDYLACYRIHHDNVSKVHSKKMLQNQKIILEKWRSSSDYFNAVSIQRFVGGDSLTKSFLTLIKDTYRLYDHSQFVKKIGLVDCSALPLMSRAWQLEAKTPDKLREAKSVLENLCVSNEPLFEVEQNSPNSLYMETAISRKIEDL